MMPPPFRLPPLNALRAFQAAARHLSFAKAAEELNVTPAAVSQQIKKLEDYLQVRLFSRHNRSLTLSEDAQLLLPGISDGFEKINAAIKSFHRRKEHGFITVSVTPSFASKWLVPRLDHWVKQHPETDIRVSASLGLVDFEKDGIDLSVRFGSGSYPGLESTFLMKESFVAVCSPIFVEGENGIRTPSDLKNHTLLHVTAPNDNYGTDWRHWLQAAGVEDVDVERGLYFDDTTVGVLSAIGGQGVLLARRALVEDDIAKGLLVMPFDFDIPLEFSWYVIAPKPNMSKPAVTAFREWLLTEAGQTDKTVAV